MFEDIYRDPHISTTTRGALRLSHLIKTKQQQKLQAYVFDSEKEKDIYLAGIHHKPTKAFETWNHVPRVSLTSLSKKRKLDEEDVPVSGNDEDEDEGLDADAEEVLEQSPSVTSANESRKLEVLMKGFEIDPPVLKLNADAKELNSHPVSFNRFHISMLNNLMHLSMLKKQWETAYNCFCLLIRMRNVNLKRIWHIGLEVLIRLEESRFQSTVKEQLDLELNSYQTRILTNFPKGQNIPAFVIRLEKQTLQDLEQLIQESNSSKVEKYLNWLKSFYGVSNMKSSTRLPAHWNSGSKHVVPLYFESLIWSFLIKLDFKNCKELLQELILQPPFTDDGVFHYMLGLCFQIEANYLYEMKELSFKEIHELLLSSLKNYEKASTEYGIKIPVEMQNDLQKSLSLIGVRHTKNLVKRRFKTNPKPAPSSAPSSPPTASSTIASSSLPSSPIPSFVKRDPDSEFELDEMAQDSKVLEDFNSLALTPISAQLSSSVTPMQEISPLSQDEFSPLVGNIEHEQRHRTRAIDASVLKFGEDEMNFDFYDDSSSSD